MPGFLLLFYRTPSPARNEQRGRGEIEPIPHTLTPTKTAHPVHNRITQQNRTTEHVRNTTKNSSVGERRTARGCTNTPDECSRLIGY
ncbi:hypothetical protein GAC16_26500, partial [Bacteroides thetaiotaomicron]